MNAQRNRSGVRPAGGLHRLGRAAPIDSELELLRAALCAPEQAAAAWHRWNAVYDIDTAPGRAYEILPAVSANLAPDVLGSDAARLRGLRRRTWAANQMSLLALAGALDVLNSAGIEVTVAKGANLLTTGSPEAGVRPMADVDILVGPEHFESSIDLLLAKGWVAKSEPPYWSLGHAACVVDPLQRQIDVHRWLMFPRFCRVEERAWCARSLPGLILDRQVQRLAAPDELVMSVVHGLLTESPSSARWPMDVAQLARSAAQDETTRRHFWEGVVTSATDIGVGPIVAAGLSGCVELFSLDVPAWTVAQLEADHLDPLVELQWWLRKLGRQALLRPRRYVDLERASGRRPTPYGYVLERGDALRRRGVRNVVTTRLGRLRSK